MIKCVASWKGSVDRLTRGYLWCRMTRGEDISTAKIPRCLLLTDDNKVVQEGSFLTLKIFSNGKSRRTKVRLEHFKPWTNKDLERALIRAEKYALKIMKTDHLNVRKDSILCMKCYQSEPINPGDGTPMETLILAYEMVAKRHQDCRIVLK